MKEIIFAKNIAELAAEKFAEIAEESIADSGQFTVALSGGSTPKKLYSILTEEPFRSQIEWQKIQFFFGDERCVAPDSEESNFRMADDNLFSKLNIPDKNIHRFMTENGEPESTALLYEQEIQKSFSINAGEFPRFDLVLLGMGDDGHTASLFPATGALKEDKRIVVGNFVPKFDKFRLTFTAPTINNAHFVIFLISGKKKAEAFRKVFSGKFDPDKLPSQLIKPTDGNLLVLADIQ